MNSPFWLVQRLKLRTPPNSDLGFDGFFRFDYMGRAEFEYGAAHTSLLSMRAKQLEVFPFALDGKTLHVVAARDVTEARIDDMLDWLTAPDHRRRTIERTYFPEILRDRADDYMLDVVAWWSYSCDMAWTLDHAVAKTLLTAFNTKVNHRG